MSDDEIIKMIVRADTDKDGKVSFDKFCYYDPKNIFKKFKIQNEYGWKCSNIKLLWMDNSIRLIYLFFSFVSFYVQNYIFIPHKKSKIICFIKP